MINRFELKEDCDIKDFQMLHPNILILFTTLLKFSSGRNLPIKVTSIISDRENVQSLSKTHDEGRAIDVSVLGWSSKDIEDIQKLLLAKHKNISAISSRDLKPRPCVYHNYNNQGDHLHLQVRR